MSTTPIDAAALAQARERLEADWAKHSDVTVVGILDLRLVLDALRDARRQAFEEAAQVCHRITNGLAVDDRDDDGQIVAVYHTEGSAVAEECASQLRALAEGERSQSHKEQS